MIRVRRLSRLDEAALDRLLVRGRLGDADVARAVTGIVAEVRDRRDAALRELALRFDRVELDALEVPRAAWDEALASLEPGLREALETAAASIRRFHEAQRPEPLELEVSPGVVLGRRPDPLGRVGVYAPGGRAAYPSSVLMGVVPARVAGVDEVVVCCPPGPDGRPPALVLAACAVAGADRLFALGGAGAIAALALGTESVPRVDRIVGPGNAYVTEAKRQLTGEVAIDSPAGPSELLVVADESADPEAAALELIAQAEHDPDAAAVLVATDRGIAEAVREMIERRVSKEPRREIVEASLRTAGALLVADTLEDALAFARRYAPEHLLLLVDEPERVLTHVRSAGTVFLGATSSVAFGDYATGANHVLPTGGLARSYSGLSLDDFVRWTTWQRVEPTAAARLAAVVTPLADAERLPAHAAAARRAAAGAPTEAAGTPAEPRDPTSATGGVERAANRAARSTKLELRPRDAYRALERYDPARKSLEIDLSANTNLWGACPAALGALRSGSAPTTYPTPYATDLKRTVAETWDVRPDQVVTGCGSDDVIDSAIRAFCDPGTTVAFPAPTFPMADIFARMNDARPVPVPMGPDGALDEDALTTLADADVVYLCRPNNPTGAMLERESALRILDRARGLVLIDEAYGEYADETLLGPALESGRGVVLRTLSKAYGLAGLRVGYALGPAPIIEAIELSRGPYKVGGPAERAATAALRDGWTWVNDIVDRTVHNRARLAGELRSRRLRVHDSAANFVLAGVGDAGSGRARALKTTLEGAGIGVRAFDGLAGVGDAIRVTVGPWSVMERFLTALDAALAAVEPTPADAEAMP